jgi:hypothetical protein
MKALVLVLCIAAFAACDSNISHRPLNGSITSALKPGMTEQQVAEVSNNRVPDRVVMTTCGTETPKPFACKVYVYQEALRAGQYDPKLSVVFEDVRGQWIVTQWL